MQVPVPIVGSKYYAGAVTTLGQIGTGERLTLRREPDNKFDPNAVSVWHDDQQLGHIPKEVARTCAPQLDRGIISTEAAYQGPSMVVLKAATEPAAIDKPYGEQGNDGWGDDNAA